MLESTRIPRNFKIFWKGSKYNFSVVVDVVNLLMLFSVLVIAIELRNDVWSSVEMNDHSYSLSLELTESTRTDAELQFDFTSLRLTGTRPGAHVGYNCPAQVPSVQTLPTFPQQYPCCEDSENLEEKQLEEERAAKAQNWKLPVCYDDDDDEERSDFLDDNIISGLPPFSAITPNEPVLSTEEPDNSLSMGDKHLDTIPIMESDERIKSSIEDLIPIPSESEGGIDDDILRENLLNVNHLFAKIEASNDNPILFYDPIISGTPLTLTPSGESDFFLESCSDEDVLEKIISKPLFEEETIPLKMDQHPDNAESDLLESLHTRDSSLPISSKIDSLLDEFVGELTLLKSISPGIDATDCDFEEDIRLIKKLLYDNSSPRPLKEFVSVNSDAESESFSPSPILVKDSDSLMEEIDLFCTLDYPMLPGIEDDDYDS
nr:hypothetical protein [Tanacetum cinerariifolium]